VTAKEPVDWTLCTTAQGRILFRRLKISQIHWCFPYVCCLRVILNVEVDSDNEEFVILHSRLDVQPIVEVEAGHTTQNNRLFWAILRTFV
jgi:hypothetical protein